jgi:hypothetical protein
MNGYLALLICFVGVGIFLLVVKKIEEIRGKINAD